MITHNNLSQNRDILFYQKNEVESHIKMMQIMKLVSVKKIKHGEKQYYTVHRIQFTRVQKSGTNLTN